MTPRLVMTPRSHFSRKVRLLADGLGIALELVDAGNVADADPALFGPNPLMKVPTLIDGDRVVLDSDHIAAWLVRTRDPSDRFGVLTQDPDVLNARAVMNGMMAAEVELVLAARTGLDIAHPRFDKMRSAIDAGLDWLEQRAALFGEEPNYLGLHLVALWDHLALYGLAALDRPRLAARADALTTLAWVSASRPA
ncbi:glutathione S-transferase family protein [Lysobacter sp. TY2-98]|uniref:glutathione S-transferase family protein n=1 Tax=Lysobacter sp. TY2-98 TaxID=2290922 RepID=UPI000E202EAD|nr:glutathione S-transferase family protein [Lysobacter sp. TY2-98]AXK72101.1 glutathione S-transferase family protein [Lysobacter sp. TY2-98]